MAKDITKEQIKKHLKASKVNNDFIDIERIEVKEIEEMSKEQLEFYFFSELEIEKNMVDNKVEHKLNKGKLTIEQLNKGIKLGVFKSI